MSYETRAAPALFPSTLTNGSLLAVMGHNNLAVSEFMLLRFSETFEQGQRVVTMWPEYVGSRASLYAMYAGRLDIAVEPCA